MRRTLLQALAVASMGAVLTALPLVASAQAVADTAPMVLGKTLNGKAFNLASLQGKVVLLMFWSTDCAVCRDKMRELRENAQGWVDKPFEVVLVSVDKRMKDVDDYNAILNQSVPLGQRFTQLWTGDPTYKDNLTSSDMPRKQLPATLLMDKQGKLIERFSGRIPADVWDKIADLL
jgi:thiol-disulfide isomerase/thioredoxin